MNSKTIVRVELIWSCHCVHFVFLDVCVSTKYILSVYKSMTSCDIKDTTLNRDEDWKKS